MLKLVEKCYDCGQSPNFSVYSNGEYVVTCGCEAPTGCSCCHEDKEHFDVTYPLFELIDKWNEYNCKKANATSTDQSP